MAEEQSKNSAGSQAQADSGSTSVGSLNVGGNVGGNVTTGNNNVVNNVTNNYYQQVVEKNTEKHEPDYWALKHLYPMPPNFTGRIAERAMLTHWLKEDSENRLFILRALGGFGKSALTWHWLTHDVDIKEYPKVVFWSFYEGDASFEHFIEETLKYLKLEVPQGGRPQVDELLKAMQSQKILLIMDGFERALRAYSSMNAAYQGDEPKIEDNQLDCVSINAEIFLKSVCSLPNLKSKVLMTTRLTPRAVKPRGECLQGCREEELTAMQKVDAVEFFRKQKIKGTHAEIEAACAPYGYHPLSLRLLAGRILKDFDNPTDIVVAQKLKIDGDIIQQIHHVLEVSYDSLLPQGQKLLSTIACFRSPVELNTLQSIAENKDSLDADLHDLVERGLLHHTTRLVSNHPVSTFDLHPIVRRYAYERLTVPDRTAAHTRLRDYFASVGMLAKPQTLDDLAPIIELYHHTVQTGNLDDAFELLRDRLHDALYYRFGSQQIYEEMLSSLFNKGEKELPQLTSDDNQGWILTAIGHAYARNGQPIRAVRIYDLAAKVAEKLGIADRILPVLMGKSETEASIGSLRTADANIRHAIKISHELELKWDEAYCHNTLGKLLLYYNEWERSENELSIALTIFEKQKATSMLSVVMVYNALRFLLMTRDITRITIENPLHAIEYALHALALVEERARSKSPDKSIAVEIHWVLGASYRHNGKLDVAEQHLIEALTRDRAINMVDHEANILLDLARLRYDQKNYEEAKSLAEEALSITERCGYVLQGADVNLFLAQYALEQEKDKVKAKRYAEEARKLATCDGPPYYYKVAYEEAERMLKARG